MRFLGVHRQNAANRYITQAKLRFLINHKKGEELRSIVADSTYQLTGYRIQQDIKNERLETTRPVKGNIEGYKEPVDVTFYTPNRIERTDQYVARRDKFYKWKELKSE